MSQLAHAGVRSVTTGCRPECHCASADLHATGRRETVSRGGRRGNGHLQGCRAFRCGGDGSAKKQRILRILDSDLVPYALPVDKRDLGRVGKTLPGNGKRLADPDGVIAGSSGMNVGLRTS